METLGKYTYSKEKRIGEGYWSRVYKAYDQCTHQNVALKIIRKNRYFSFSSMKNEVEKMIGLENAHVIDSKDCNKIDGKYYISTEFATDGDLKEKIKTKTISTKQALVFCLDILDGIHAIHQKEIVHLDIKPDNIFLKGDVPKIGDLGLAKYLHAEKKTEVSSGGEHEYLPPEYLQDRIATKSVDLWSVAVILYEMLYNETPYDRKNFNLPRYETITHYPELVSILKKALNTTKELRYKSAIEFSQALQNIIQKECRKMNKVEQGQITLGNYEGKGRSEMSAEIKFNTHFTKTPIVPCSLKKLDMYSKDNVLRYELIKSAVTNKGCVITIKTWESHLNDFYSCDIEWLAIGE